MTAWFDAAVLAAFGFAWLAAMWLVELDYERKIDTLREIDRRVRQTLKREDRP
jgi:hypothetical protein